MSLFIQSDRPVEVAEIITPVLELTNIQVSEAQLVGAIYWASENQNLTVTGDVGLPDGTYMVMAERVVDAEQVVDDARFKAVVLDGQMEINAKFSTTGNYLFSASRINRGLDRINAGVNLAFDSIEFDIYV